MVKWAWNGVGGFSACLDASAALIGIALKLEMAWQMNSIACLNFNCSNQLND